MELASGDWLGFDVDHALVRYNIEALWPLIHQAMINFLVEEKDYDKSLLQLEFDPSACQKGVVIDWDTGNFLKLAHDGCVMRAAHGSKMMSAAEVTEAFGNRPWKGFEMLRAGTRSRSYSCFTTYFDIPVQHLVAVLVDMQDERAQSNEYNFASDLFEAFDCNYDYKSFGLRKGWFFPTMIDHTERFVFENSDSFKQWLCKCPARKWIATNSHGDFASLILARALGSEWKTFFDLVCVYVRKPGFFDAEPKDRPFYEVAEGGSKEGACLLVDDLAMDFVGKVYAQGNFTQLIQQRMWSDEGKESDGDGKKIEQRQIVYIGDSLLSDCAAAQRRGCRTVSIVEEIENEGPCNAGVSEPAPSKKQRVEEGTALSSNGAYLKLGCARWGSFYGEKEDGKTIASYWAGVVEDVSSLTMASVDGLVSMGGGAPAAASL
jgi:HAD superfamily 5'-nucleotidase-like hydrolase